MPDIYVAGARRLSWHHHDGKPVIEVMRSTGLDPASALALADAIYEAVAAAREAQPEAPSLFDIPHARSTDPGTSHAAAKTVRVGSHIAHLLAAYCDFPEGLTDEEAGTNAGLAGTGYWKRCSDLRAWGWIARTGTTRAGSTGAAQEVCSITDAGRSALVKATKE